MKDQLEHLELQVAQLLVESRRDEVVHIYVNIDDSKKRAIALRKLAEDGLGLMKCAFLNKQGQEKCAELLGAIGILAMTRMDWDGIWKKIEPMVQSLL